MKRVAFLLLLCIWVSAAFFNATEPAPGRDPAASSATAAATENKPQKIELVNFFERLHEKLEKEGKLPAWLTGETGEEDFTMAINSVLIILVLIFLFNLVKTKGALVPGTTQNVGEWIYESLYDLIVQFSSEQTARKYFPWLASYFIYILMSNLWGLIPGFHTPTGIYNTTLAFALMSVTVAIGIAIKETGLGGFIKHLAGDMPTIWILMLPLGLIEQLARVLSLSLRLFGNMFGEDIAIAVFAFLGAKFFLPVQTPIMILHVLFSVIQAMIFTVLSASYIDGFTHGHNEHEEGASGHSAPAHHHA